MISQLLVFLHFCHAGEIWTVLIICESNPLVISMPIQHGNSKAYSTLRFLFLYHGTRSCCTILVKTGSASCAWAAWPTGGAILSEPPRSSLLQFTMGGVCASDVRLEASPASSTDRFDFVKARMDLEW